MLAARGKHVLRQTMIDMLAALGKHAFRQSAGGSLRDRMELACWVVSPLVAAVDFKLLAISSFLTQVTQLFLSAVADSLYTTPPAYAVGATPLQQLESEQ